MSYERTTKDSVEYIANKFAENPGHFAATILRMYWDMEKQRDQYKAERDTLIDDIAVLKANISRLEKRVSELVHENVRLQNDLFTEELNQDEADFVIKKLRKQYTTLTDHIRLKASANPGEHRYIALVNFVDRLEKGETNK